MNSNKEKIIEFAKIQYLEVNADGFRINTWNDISKSIQKKFKQKINYSTIAKWSKKYDWESLFEKLKMAGIEKGKEQLQEKENKIIDEKSQTIADIYKSNKQLHVLSQKTIISRITGNPFLDSKGNEIKSEIGTTDLIRILQHSENGLLELLDKRKPETSKINIEHLSTEELIKRAEAARLIEKSSK
jgi:hypothetical protein